jgi:hypothetical protein
MPRCEQVIILIGPYNGGVDVIAKSPHTCYALKQQFKDWLSLRPDGLYFKMTCTPRAAKASENSLEDPRQ